MNQIIATFLMLFIPALCVSVFYWQIAHKVLTKRILYRLFARRDALRSLAITGEANHSSFAYQETERFICKTISVVPSISLAFFLWFFIENRQSPSSQAKRLREEASPQIITFLDKTIKDALIIMFLNSPILFLVGFALSVTFWIVGRFNKMMVISQAESFVDKLPSGVELQTA